MAKKKETFKDLEVIAFKTYALWLKWLAKNFKKDEGIWIKFGKKGSGLESISYEEAREGALIYGWIDGQLYKYDSQSYLRKFTPRRKKSMWSKINREIAEGLIRSRLMKPTGLAEVKLAKADGRWDSAYDSPATIKPTAEFNKLLNANPKAKKFFSTLDKTNRYSFLVRMQMAKTKATRDKRMRETIELLNDGKVLHSERVGKKRKMRWCVLLRGINVGGNRPIKMAELREALETAKFQDVETYIQSGNILVSSEKSVSAIEKSIKKLIKEQWGWDVPVQAIQEKELMKIVKGNPFKDLDSTKIAVTRFDKVIKSADIASLKDFVADNEQMVFKKNVAYLFLPKGAARTKLTNGLFEKKLACSATTRNWRTIKKLLEMFG